MWVFQAPKEQSVADVHDQLFAANTLFVAASCLLLVWVLWRIDRRRPQPHLKLWIASWCSYLLARGITLLQIDPHVSQSNAAWVRAGMSALSQGSYYLHVVLLLLGVMHLAGARHGRIGRRGLTVMVLAVFGTTVLIAWATQSAEVSTRMFFRVALRSVVTAAVFAVVGVLLLRLGRRVRRIGAQLTAVAMFAGAFLSGLLAYAFSAGRYTEVAPYLGGLEVLVVSSIGLGLVFWLQEDLAANTEDANQALSERTQELLQAQRLQSVGQVASGVAHDFNNVLTVVVGNAEALLDAAAPYGRLPDQARELVVDIRSAATQAAKMTSQLLAMGRRSVEAPRPVDIDAAVAELEPLLRRLAGSKVDLRLVRAPAPCMAMLQPGHVEQILVNLVVNARDAIAERGTMVVEAWALGDRVGLRGSDDGCGMTESVRARVGELFFTTKAGRGNGMGMASVRSILAQTHGEMSIDSEPGVGTRITVAWPAAAANPDGARGADYVLPRSSAAPPGVVDRDTLPTGQRLQ